MAVPHPPPSDHAAVDTPTPLGPVDGTCRENGIDQCRLNVIRPAPGPLSPLLALADGRTDAGQDSYDIVW
jgi:hypothetical protein